jgi:hypothetical protein
VPLLESKLRLSFPFDTGETLGSIVALSVQQNDDEIAAFPAFVALESLDESVVWQWRHFDKVAAFPAFVALESLDESVVWQWLHFDEGGALPALAALE